MAAIGVMKNRKARPDGKRISNWIHRRYGRPMISINAELEKMVTAGELSRVDYKGSASYRITTPEAKNARKRRRLQQKNNSASSLPSPLSVEPILRQPNIPKTLTNYPQASITPQFFTGQEISLRTLVWDLLGEMSGGTTAPCSEATNVSVKFIKRAVECSRSNINRPAVLANLEVILDKEIQAGHFVRSGEDQYILQPINSSFLPVLTSTIINPAPKPPPPNAGPPPFLSTSSAPPPPKILNVGGGNPTLADYASAGGLFNFPVNNSVTPPLPNLTKMTFIPTKTPSVTINEVKVEDEKKDNLIQDKINRSGKSISPVKKVVSATPEPIPLYLALREKKIKGTSEELITPKVPLKSSSAKKVKKGNKVLRSKRRKTIDDEEEEEDELDILDDEEEDEENRSNSEDLKRNKMSSKGSSSISASTRSSRKKKCRKIFDPADHETPTRKKKNASSPTPSSIEEDFTPKEDICQYCYGTAQKNRKGKVESLLKCKDCLTTVHASCLDYGEELAKKIIQAPWQCINCKSCSGCEIVKEGVPLIFCDSCDLSYHHDCHIPKILPKIIDKWECHKCKKMSKIKLKTESNENGALNFHHDKITQNGSTNSPIPEQVDAVDLVNRFTPILPPHIHPHTGVLPENWEDYPPDPSIPDVSQWNQIQVGEYFLRYGFTQNQAKVFLDQEIDGKSLLLLQRSDVTSSLGLKLGPALKIFSIIKKLQTRRNFPG